MEELKYIISNNLILLRKNAKLTQLEFSSKINYSDKAVSKWEKGESMPSIDVLKAICDFYGITLNDIISDNVIKNGNKQRRRPSPNKYIITGLSILCVWLLATITFVYAQLLWDMSAWLAFVWAVPISLIVALVFSCIWGKMINVFVVISFLVWSILASFYLSFLEYNFWILFLLGVPLQISIILWSKIKPHKD